jgi:predicted MPP superfamily phosphohydrolase
MIFSLRVSLIGASILERMRFLRAGVGWATAGGAALAAYSLIEAQLPRLQVKEVALPHSRPPLKILHLGDTHLQARDVLLQRWLRRLPDLLPGAPDLVLATGDLIDDDGGIAPLLESIRGITGRYGNFYVRGSHDLFQSRYRPPTKYLKDPVEPPGSKLADTPRLERGLEAQGWVALTNRSEKIDTPLGRIRLAGVDDPYLRRHSTDHIFRSEGDDLALALVHSPDVVSEWALAGFDLIVAGHTHGGQVRLPFLGAMVTNSSLPTSLASGLHKIGSTWLHVTPGLGTSKFTPIRFLCRPEATFLRLVPQDAFSP